MYPGLSFIASPTLASRAKDTRFFGMRLLQVIASAAGLVAVVQATVFYTTVVTTAYETYCPVCFVLNLLIYE